MSRAYYYSSTGGITGSTDNGMVPTTQPGIAGTPYWKMRSDDAESHCAEKQQSNCPRAMCLERVDQIRLRAEWRGLVFFKSAKHPMSNLHSNYGVLAATRHFDDDYQLASGSRLALTLAIKGISNTTQRA
ncbi:hypothetical protein CFAM422_005892 [Trichoderma lentiforme]|uniref:Uncharacterized protein n=1 Tax=Trichoderma lentiforme TaxID=1567552 RepID=A0A9P4XDS4_9HYPO|nr:hypothetical protein CFAM422_005892 [Trichoderma lentiforme]